jgi:hypothetical protein
MLLQPITSPALRSRLRREGSRPFGSRCANTPTALRSLPDSKIGTFSQALYDKAMKDDWIVISMKKDWKRIFALE